MVESAQATDTRTLWSFDQQYSQIGFSGRHMGIALVRGLFGSFRGAIIGDLENPVESEISLEIDVASMSTCNEQRDGHLLTADFLDVETYPTITFASTSVRERSANSFEVTGNLTFHGVTREVVLDATMNGVVTSPFGEHVVGVSVGMTVDRRDFGIDINIPLSSGGLALANEVRIEAEIEAVDRGSVSCPLCHPEG